VERDVLDEWQFVKSDKRETIKFTPKLIADGEALREAALAGCGIVRNLTFNVADEMRSGALLRVLPIGNVPGPSNCCDLPKVETDAVARQCISATSGARVSAL